MSYSAISINPNLYFFASSKIDTQSTGVSSSTFTTFSNSPSLSVACTSTGTYKVYCNAQMESDSSTGSFITIVGTSGSPTLLYESWGELEAVGSSGHATCFVQSVFTLTSGNTYVFNVQGKTASGTIYFGNKNTYMFAEKCG